MSIQDDLCICVYASLQLVLCLYSLNQMSVSSKERVAITKSRRRRKDRVKKSHEKRNKCIILNFVFLSWETFFVKKTKYRER